MDPQQSMLLDVGYTTLNQKFLTGCARPVRDALMHENIGVFVGVEASGFHSHQVGKTSLTGGSLSVTSGRLSYTLGLVGPCNSIDTACASALAALHLCAGSVRDNYADGIGIGTKILSWAANLAMSEAMMTSPLG